MNDEEREERCEDVVTTIYAFASYGLLITAFVFHALVFGLLHTDFHLQTDSTSNFEARDYEDVL